MIFDAVVFESILARRGSDGRARSSKRVSPLPGMIRSPHRLAPSRDQFLPETTDGPWEESSNGAFGAFQQTRANAAVHLTRHPGSTDGWSAEVSAESRYQLIQTCRPT